MSATGTGVAGPSVRPGIKVRALLIEDSPEDSALLLRALERGGYQVTADEVQTREEFLRHVQAHAYDIIFADYNLPQWTGIQALELLREQNLDIPLILVTGMLGDEMAAESIKRGATDYVLKENLTRLPLSLHRALREKQLRAQHKHSEEVRHRLADVVESCNDAIVTKTLKGEITAWNSAANEMFGYSSDEAIGKTMPMLIPPDRVDEEPDILARIRRGESIKHFDTVRIRKDGKSINISATISPIRDSTGAIIGVSKIARDITERKQAEQTVRESVANMEAALKDLADQKFALDQHAEVSMTDVEGRITYANDRFCSISKYSREELLGKNHRVLNSSFHPQEFFRQMYETIGRGQVWHGEIRNRTKEGELFWSHSTIVPFLGTDGKPRQYVAIRADITKRKLAEEELARKADELARSNADLEQFAYVASHDLQEPLRMVAAYAQLLSERYKGKLDENADKFIGYVSEGAERMQVLIHDLLAFSRVGRKGAVCTSVDCDALVDEVRQSLAGAIQESGAVISCSKLPTLKADRTQIAQLFQNLIGNAIKFRGKKPPIISVGAERQGQCWQFHVTDNGIGIAPEYAENIFVIFQRLHLRSEYPGNGIGLAICKKIVERRGGKIWVESLVGSGATFKFTVPLHYSGPEKEAAQ